MATTIALVGKPNVGKSTLFNRIIGRRQAIVYDQPGVTRDRIYQQASWGGQNFTIIDTGGISTEKRPLIEQIRLQAEIAIAEAQVVILVVDGRHEISSEDLMVVNLLRKSGKPTVLAVNKLENHQQLDYSVYGLGLAEVFLISALHGQGVGALLDWALAQLPKVEQTSPSAAFQVAIIGKPNAGKSSLLNKLIRQNRAIVSAQAGTTRDSINAFFTINQERFEIIDTAGIKRKSKLVEAVEHYALLRAMQALEASDLSLLVIDATQPLSHFDARIAGYAMEVNKPLIIIINKWDLIAKTTHTMNHYTKQLRQGLKFATWAPVVFCSALTGLRVETIKQIILAVKTNITRRIKSGLLNEMILEIQQLQPAPSFKGRRLNITHIKQIEGRIPTFLLTVNNTQYLHFSYRRYIENQLREYFDFQGTPIQLLFKNKRQ